MWILCDFGDHLAARGVVIWHSAKVCDCIRLDRSNLGQRFLLDGDTEVVAVFDGRN